MLRFAVATALCSVAIIAPRAQDANQPITFRAALDVVTIQASVRDHRGRVVNGLTATDFEVRDNGQVRPILSIRADRQSPLSLAILVDMSGSMRIGSKVAMARQAYDSVLSQLRQGQDEAAVFTFDNSFEERHEFTRELGTLKDALADFSPFGTTSLYDATAEAARRLAARSATHKAIIVLTDGIDTSSALTAREVSGLASSIVESSGRSTPHDVADLRDLSEWTGGQLIFSSTFGETIVAASRLVDELRQQYVLAIEAANSGEWRRLDVRVVKRPATVVKARSGYYAG